MKQSYIKLTTTSLVSLHKFVFDTYGSIIVNLMSVVLFFLSIIMPFTVGFLL